MLKKLRILVSLLSFLLIFVYCLAFAARNSNDVAVFFLIGEPLSLPLALWFGVVLGVGCLSGILVASYSIIAKQRHIKRLEKKLAAAEERLSRLP